MTVRFKNEKERNITIKLGYANAKVFLIWLVFFYSFTKNFKKKKIYKCDNLQCPRPSCYRSAGSGKEDEFPCDRPNCTGKFKLLRHISFVDCPGHDILMATMLNGAAVMDAVLLLIGNLFILFYKILPIKN